MECLKRLYGKTIIDNADSEEIKKDRKIELEYYQLQSETSEKPYGIEIVKRNMNNNKIDIEKKMIQNISYNEEETNKLLEILKKSKVTPITIEDVLTDLIKGKVI